MIERRIMGPMMGPAAIIMLATTAAGSLPANTSPAIGAGLGAAGLAQISLPSRDLERSVRFYRDALGLKLLFRVPNGAFFDIGGLRLRIEQSDAAPGAANQIYFDDPGLRRIAELKARGVTMDGNPEIAQHKDTSDLMIQDFKDPDGNALALIGDVRHAKR